MAENKEAQVHLRAVPPPISHGHEKSLRDLVAAVECDDYSHIDSLPGMREAMKTRDINRIVETYAVPSDKEALIDLIEFTREKGYPAFTSRTAGNEWVYKKKYAEAIGKARALYSSDPDFESIFMEHSKVMKAPLRSMGGAGRGFFRLLIILIVVVLLAVLADIFG